MTVYLRRSSLAILEEFAASTLQLTYGRLVFANRVDFVTDTRQPIYGSVFLAIPAKFVAKHMTVYLR